MIFFVSIVYCPGSNVQVLYWTIYNAHKEKHVIYHKAQLNIVHICTYQPSNTCKYNLYQVSSYITCLISVLCIIIMYPLKAIV